MTIRQNILKMFYPFLMKINKSSDKNAKILHNKNNILPQFSFYNLKCVDNSGNEISFEQFTGKKILIVNTASDCGYTTQYSSLQRLYNNTKERLIILGFPSNNFGKQEKGNDEKIAQFCEENYAITFPLMKKSVVIKTSDQNSVYKWLTDSGSNGWNDHQPDWNFSKYLIDEKGVLTYYFGPAVSPLGEEIELAIKNHIE